MESMTDNETVAMLDSNPSEGIRQMINSYSSMVYTIVCSKLGNVLSSDDIEEFVSFVFSRIYERRKEIDLSRGSLKGYISTVAKRMSIDEYCRLNSRVKTTPITDEIAETATDHQNIQYEIERSFDEKALVEALGRLDKTDRTIILWRYYFNKTSAQIAVEMNSSDAAVRKRLSRALEKLRLLLSEKNT